MAVKQVNDDAAFQAELNAAGNKLVVVDFNAVWCGPCKIMGPIFDRLAGKYSRAIFIKVDVDQCQDTAAKEGVSAMPTFIFYRMKTKIDRVQGADQQSLEAKILQYIGESSEETSEEFGLGMMDLNSFIARSESECLNEDDEFPLSNCLSASAGYLRSDCDEQLIISISFNQAVKIHSLKVKAPTDNGPKTLKLFINQPRTIDFDLAETCASVQDLTLEAKDLDGTPIQLKYVKFQNVMNIQLFIKDNQSGNDFTQIDYISFIGSPITTTKMGDFKRISGKKGESH